MPTSPLRIIPDEQRSRMVVANQLSAADTEQMQHGADSQLQRGWRAGSMGISAGELANEAISGEKSGDPDWQAKRDTALRIAQESGEIGPRVSSLRDVHGAGDALDYASGSVGQGLASMTPTLAAALLTRGRGGFGKATAFGGAMIPAYRMERGEAVVNQYADPTLAAASVEDRDRVAMYKGGVNAALESIVPAGLAGSILRKPTTGFLGAVGRNMMTEGATEVAQEYTGHLAEKALDPSRQLDPMRLADAGVMGALTGGGVSAVGLAPTHAANALGDRVGSRPPNTPPVAPAAPGQFEEILNSAKERFGPKVEEAYGTAKDYVSAFAERANEAVKTAQNPGDFVRQVFSPSAEEQAQSILQPEHEDPTVLNAADPAAGLDNRDARNATSAADLAGQLMDDPATPQFIRDKIDSMGGDYSSKANQAYIASTLLGVKGGKKIVDAVGDFVAFSKEMAAKAGTIAEDIKTGVTDRVSKKNLQDIHESDVQPLVNLLAKKLGPTGVAQAPQLAKQLVAAANRLSPNGQINEAVDRRLRNFSEAIDDETLDMVTELSGSDALRNSIAKIRAIPSAMSDVRQAAGGSFLESMVTNEEARPLMPQIARAVDELALAGTTAPARASTLEALAAGVFGSVKNAQTVVEYYGKMRRSAYKLEAEQGLMHDDQVAGVTEMFLDQPSQPKDATYEGAASTAEWGALSEKDGPGVEVGFRNAATKRPFRKFAGEKLSSGSTRREAWRAINDARGKEDADYATQDYSEYLGAQGIAPTEGVAMVRQDIENRIKEHEARKGEDRSQQINELKGERELFETVLSDKGEKAALDQYEVTTRSARASSDNVATDDDIKSMKTAVRAKPETVVEFRKVDGKVLKLSADSMIKTLGLSRQKKGGIETPLKQNRAQMFADAAASVLARDDIAGIISDLKKVVLDPASGTPVERTYSPDRMAALSEFEALQNKNSKGVPARRKFIKAQLAELEGALDDLGDPATGGFDEMQFDELRNDWEKSAADAVQKAKDRVEVLDKARTEAREAYYGDKTSSNFKVFERARALFDYARGAVGDYVEFQKAVKSAFYDLQREVDEASKSGVPESKTDEPAIMRTGESVRSGQKSQASSEDTELAIAADPNKLEVLDRRGDKDNKATIGRVREAQSYAQAVAYADDVADSTDRGDGYWAQNKQTTVGDKRKPPNAAEHADLKKKILEEIRRTRGNDVKLRFNRLIKHIGASGEFSMNADKTERLIEIAVNAADPMGVAWHESLHDFFAMLGEDKSSRSIKRDLVNAANAPQVKKRLRELLKDHPEALKQLEESPEERVAYMYQFWAAGDPKLRVGPLGTGTFEKIRAFFRDLFRLVGRHERAQDLMAALHEGKFADTRVAAEVLADMPRETINNRMERYAPALKDTMDKLVQTAPDRLRDFQNEHISSLADRMEKFIQRRNQRDGEWTNKLAGILDGTTATQRRAALENMQAMKPPSSPLEHKLAKFFKDMHGYMTDAGVMTLDSKTKQWVPLREVTNYFPRVFDRAALEKDPDGFVKLLMKHGNMTEASARNTLKALTHGTGQIELAENEHALGFSPYAQAVQDRQLKFIDPSNAAEFAKYQSKDLPDITASYVKQAVHRAEYARDFGNRGEEIAKVVAQSGVTDKKDLENINKIVMGLEGTLGYQMSSQTKELFSGILTLQNLVILPLAIFSQVVDPIVLAARSGDLRDAGNAYVTALKKLTRQADVDGEDIAEMLGIISQDTVLEAMGVAYGTTHMSKRMRNINRVFFKWNGMQGWNNAMRIAATAAGERYLLQNKDNEAALKELGLEPSDIKTKVSFMGKPNAQNKVVGKERLDVSDPKVKEAMFKFVDQAVLRPSAANRPVWMSDPKFLLVAHLKQFTFAMHNVVLKRANAQLDDGNPKPWLILALAMPTILAADMAKFALTGGPPPGWGFKEFLGHAVERSGLLGLGDFGAQATQGVGQGKMPGEALLGPSFEHLMELLRFLLGAPGVDSTDVIDRTVPGARFV